MTASLKIGLEERTNDIERLDRRDEVSRQTEHIRVVVLTRQLCQLGVPAQCCTDTLVLIGGHADTITSGADDDTKLVFAFLYCFRQRMRIIRIVTTLGVVAAEILHLGTIVLEEQLYLLLECKTSVVTCHRDGHF